MGQIAMANACLDGELLQHPSGIALEADMHDFHCVLQLAAKLSQLEF